jgi:xanthine/uracil permease
LTSEPHTAPSNSIFANRPIATATAIGVVSLLPHFFLTPELSLAFAAILLGVIAGIYFGFAVVRGSNVQQQIEFNVASLFIIAALLGMGLSPWFLPAAYLAHALWDLAHHNRSNLKLVSIPQWYIPWCVIIDVIVGLGLIAIWHWNGVL